MNTNIAIEAVVIQRYAQEGRNGDRAIVRKPYWDYKVLLRKRQGLHWGDRPASDIIVAEFDGYDCFMVSIRADREAEARAYAERLAEFFGLGTILIDTFHQQTTTTWVKE